MASISAPTFRRGRSRSRTARSPANGRRLQIARAQQDHFMIYENEWYLGGKELGPFGQRHVADIAAHINGTPFKVAIEPHFDVQRNAPDEELNNARVEAVAKSLVA